MSWTCASRLERIDLMCQDVLVWSGSAVAASNIFHCHRKEAASTVKHRGGLLVSPLFINCPAKQDRIRHNVKKHHEGEGHDETNESATKRQEFWLLHKVWAQRIHEAWSMSDNEPRLDISHHRNSTHASHLKKPSGTVEDVRSVVLLLANLCGMQGSFHERPGIQCHVHESSSTDRLQKLLKDLDKAGTAAGQASAHCVVLHP
mmetsp:Transcript_104246/g.185235  ORF Transcript_104246/g.185235 Transcript_104246/m.185235 type:complete len:203 (-) Transcript_104246:1829-2437(-)